MDVAAVLDPQTTILRLEVCSAIYKVLQPDYMKLPSSPQKWKDIANEGYHRWNFRQYSQYNLDLIFIAIRDFIVQFYWHLLTMIIVFWQLMVAFKVDLVIVVCSRILQCILP